MSFAGIATAVGSAIFSTALKGVMGGGDSGGSQQYIQPPPKSSLSDIRDARSKSAIDILGKQEKVAKAETAKVPSIQKGVLEDPWQPMHDWWDALGGKGKLVIDDTGLP